ncbi:MAG: hypothetical protein DRP70_02720 [Spirochaetes bacterium]|nr:MAG: hypothetical protein DRP70_02720 [Spirochaetota bacterium]RKX98954.1 MAG: hypothetical protein DRZ90_00835 [Spirochaetota bacterium]
MGRNILRRSALIFLLAAGFHIQQGFSESGPFTPKQNIGNNTSSFNRPYQPVRQNQSTVKAWSVDVESTIGLRPEFTFWFDKWNTDNGRKKISISLERFFEFRKPVYRIIRESGLPWELAAIPIVESNWRINAVSSSGAAGPWQFLESSARGRHLVIDAWRDERRDVWRSTEAAMSELAFYNRLFSDWLLAAASYNAGPTRISRLREESGLSSYWELLDAGLLPPETRNYVPQIIAVAYITSHAGRLGLPVNWEAPTTWVQIPLDRSIHVQKMIDALGMNEELVKAAYQGLHHPFTPPPSLPYSLKVPEKDAEDTRKWLESLEQDNAPERFWRYTVQSGDTLSEIARNNGISLSDLLSYNNHVSNGVLRIGERLYLPGNEIKPEGADDDVLPVWGGRYHVVTGDTFWSIARSYGIRPEKLAEANHRPLTGILLAGSVLHVPGKEEEL